MNKTDLIKYHVDKDYFVKVKKIDDKMITATFPENNTFRPYLPKLLKTYIISYDSIEIYGCDGTKVSKKVPIYTKRLIILRDITSVAAIYGITSDLILSYNAKDERLDEKTNLLSLMREPEAQKDIELEIKLLDVLVKTVNDEDFEVSDEIMDGFNFIMKGIS